MSRSYQPHEAEKDNKARSTSALAKKHTMAGSNSAPDEKDTNAGEQGASRKKNDTNVGEKGLPLAIADENKAHSRSARDGNAVEKISGNCCKCGAQYFLERYHSSHFSRHDLSSSTFVMDTCGLMNLPTEFIGSMAHFNCVIIPFVVIHEIDGLAKHRDPTVEVRARALRDFISSNDRIHLQKRFEQLEDWKPLDPDDRVLGCALYFKMEYAADVRLVTEDLILRLKCRAEGVNVTNANMLRSGEFSAKKDDTNVGEKGLPLAIADENKAHSTSARDGNAVETISGNCLKCGAQYFLEARYHSSHFSRHDLSRSTFVMDTSSLNKLSNEFIGSMAHFNCVIIPFVVIDDIDQYIKHGDRNVNKSARSLRDFISSNDRIHLQSQFEQLEDRRKPLDADDSVLGCALYFKMEYAANVCLVTERSTLLSNCRAEGVNVTCAAKLLPHHPQNV